MLKKLVFRACLLGALAVVVTACTEFEITLINRPPVVILAGFPTQGTAPFSVEFDASASYDPDGDSFTITWHFIESGIVRYGTKVSYTFDDDSDFNNDGWQEGYHIKIIAKDIYNNITEVNLGPVVVLNPRPVANFTVYRSSNLTLVPISFDATASYDPAGIVVQPHGKIIDYRWDFGDGLIGYGPVVQHSYLKKGNYIVTLSLTDDDYEITQKSQVISVENRVPIAKINYWFSPSQTEPQGIIIVPRPITFDGSGSFDEDGFIVNYVWYFSDGLVMYGPRVERAFEDKGPHQVILEVVDDNGDIGRVQVLFQL